MDQLRAVVGSRFLSDECCRAARAELSARPSLPGRAPHCRAAAGACTRGLSQGLNPSSVATSCRLYVHVDRAFWPCTRRRRVLPPAPCSPQQLAALCAAPVVHAIGEPGGRELALSRQLVARAVEARGCERGLRASLRLQVRHTLLISTVICTSRGHRGDRRRSVGYRRGPLRRDTGSAGQRQRYATRE